MEKVMVRNANVCTVFGRDRATHMVKDVLDKGLARPECQMS